MRKFIPRQQPLADLVGASIRPATARQGFSDVDLLLYWDDIVGERLAAMAQPVKLNWPARRNQGYDAELDIADSRTAVRAPARSPAPTSKATLVLRVDPAFALDLQHESGILIERINAHLGWNCIGRLVLQQGPITRSPTRPLRPGAPDREAVGQAEGWVETFTDDPLRQALIRLGARILQRDRTR